MIKNADGNNGGLSPDEFYQLQVLQGGVIPGFCGTTTFCELRKYAALSDWNTQTGIRQARLTEFAQIGRPEDPVSVVISGNLSQPQNLDGFKNVVCAYDKLILEKWPKITEKTVEPEGNTYHIVGVAIPGSDKVALFQTDLSYIAHWCKPQDIKYEGDDW